MRLLSNPKAHLLIFFLIMFVDISLAFANEQRGQLIIEFSGFDNNDGEFGAALAANAEQFLGQEKDAIKILRTPLRNQRVTWVIDQLPYGDYAIVSYHDENNNHHYDKNFLGIPVEDYGFSNNLTVKNQVPDFDQARFSFNQNHQVIQIEIKDYSLSRIHF